MKLYLSSYRIPTPDDFLKLIGKPAADIHIGIIPNAKDYYAPRAWEYKVKDFTSYLASLGIKSAVVDLRLYSGQEEVMNALKDFDAIWALGGNTFCLRYEMKRSGFDDAIWEFLAIRGVYGGDSAGAIVAGASLEGIALGDEPSFAAQIIEEGLSLVPFAIVPHADSPVFAEAAKRMTELQSGKREVITLKDSQAIIVNGDERKIVEAR